MSDDDETMTLADAIAQLNDETSDLSAELRAYLFDLLLGLHDHFNESLNQSTSQ